MEQIIILILFVFPGVFVSLLYKEYLPRSKNESTDYEKTVIAFIYSFAVLVLNIIIMKLVYSKDVQVLTQLMDQFKNTGFLIKYVGLTFTTSILFAVVWHFIFKRIILKIQNIFRVKGGLTKITQYPNVWDEIFANPETDLNDLYVSIEKDGELITQGLIALYSPIDAKEKEIKLICTDAFKMYLDNDKTLPDEKKILKDIDFEYFDMEKGILIKFYNTVMLKKHLSQNNNS